MIVEEQKERLDGWIAGNVFEMVDAACDISVFCIGEIYKYGTDAEIVLGSGDIKDWLLSVNELPYDITLSDFNNRITFMLGSFLEAETHIEKVQWLAYMTMESFHEVITLGFDPDKCMDEVMKEISSRTGAYNETTKKWTKFKTPEAKALWYSADFTNCKLV
jgi:hypothetical protein